MTTIILALGFTGGAGAFASNAVSFAAVEATHPLLADIGHNDPAWDSGQVNLQGGFANLTTRGPATHVTTVDFLYDQQFLYVRFHCEQGGTPIVAAQSTNNVGFGNDDFAGVGIDTSGNGSQVYFFETTPRGVRYQQASENSRYQPQWHASARTASGNWDAELIIPLHVLRIHGGSLQTWRVNFIRNVAALGEHYTWAYDGIMQDGAVGQVWPAFTDARFWPTWNDVRVSGTGKASRPSPRAEVFALGSAGLDRNLFVEANGSIAQEHVRHVGIDLSYPVTNTINLVGTLDPDFSNVEVDQQTIAPQEFRRSLLEYRPFFAQGANYINPNPVGLNGVTQPPDLVFYSPSVGPFNGGEKVEGTFGQQSFGVLHFRGYDETTGNAFNDVAYGYKHALPDRTFQYWADGVIANHSIVGRDDTAEVGVAGRNNRTGFVWGADHAFENGTWVPYTGVADDTNGFIDVHKPNYEVNLGYQDISPFFNPVDGFTTNSDVRGPSFYVNFAGATPGVKNYFVFAGVDRFVDGSGQVHQADSTLTLNVTFKNKFSLNGLGPTISELRSYAVVNPGMPQTNCADPALPRSAFSGYPNYLCGQTDDFNLMAIPIGYDDGTPTPIDASVSYGRFDGNNQHLYTLSTSRPIGRLLSLGLEYDGSYQRSLATGELNSQFLRRISIGAQLGGDTNLTISLRGVNGLGGFTPQPGTNLAFAFHRRFQNGDELFINYGTPAAYTTLDRLIVKYLFRFGGDAGT
ncbi:MAG: DUF5916 domain-containing protein [Vulcanimicrobiaceae bacterium]